MTSAKHLAVRLFNALGLDNRRLSEPVPPATEQVLADLDLPFRDALFSMYRGEPQLGLDGQRHPIDTLCKIFPSQGMWLYEMCRSLKPAATLEIGMCYGFSTLFFLAAIAKNGTGRHTAVDPDVRRHWHGIALASVQSLGMNSSFRFVEERSARAATDLAREGSLFDLIFIDGSHRFDDATVDFYLYAPLCSIGGRIIFDDMWMKSIQTAVAFVRTNRKDFVELPKPHENTSVFQRIAADAREWDHFHPFPVAGNADGYK
jgi:predicted O-methyltransferase YrrM